jgi:hypothetical protein
MCSGILKGIYYVGEQDVDSKVILFLQQLSQSQSQSQSHSYFTTEGLPSISSSW